jgi:hypothetical protein
VTPPLRASRDRPHGLSRWGALLAGGLLTGGSARAATCCLPAGGASPEVLGAEERLGFALGVRAGAWTGNHGLDGAWAPAGADHRRALQLQPALLLRVADRLQLGAGLPVERLDHRLGDAAEADLGLADLSLSARRDGGRDPRPHLWDPALSVALSLPTGGSAAEANGVTGADVHGAGALVGSAALSYEGRSGQGPYALGLGWQHPFEAGAGHRLRPSLVAGWTLTEGLDLLGVAAPWFDTGGAWAAELGLSLPYRPSPSLRLLPSLSAELPGGGLGRAAPAWINGRLGVLWTP